MADWLLLSGVPPLQLITLGPGGFEAYVRLRFIPDPTKPDQEEADVELEEGHLSDIRQTERALHVLESFTGTPEQCYFCVWEGYSDIILPESPTDRLIQLPHRRYMLLQGAVTDIDNWCSQLGGEIVAPPAFAWPADHCWCFTSDVDPHWAGIGGTQEAIGALLKDTALDIVRARPGDEPPAYR